MEYLNFTRKAERPPRAQSRLLFLQEVHSPGPPCLSALGGCFVDFVSAVTLLCLVSTSV